MRRIDDLAQGTYELEVVREEGAPGAASSLNPVGAYRTGGVARRILRVVSTSEEVEDARWQTMASPGARFIARVRGPADVILLRK